MSAPFLFVSHVSEDRTPAVELVAELERRGVSCWIAPRNVRPGKPYDDEIAEAIDTCMGMLLIFSEHCNESDYIRREITVAGEARKLIIPFRIEDVQPKRGLRVRLADLHWIDGFVSREQAIETLIESVLPREIQGSAPARRLEVVVTPVEPQGGSAQSRFEWDLPQLLRSADRGDTKSQLTLALLYESGDGVTKDLRQAVRWYQKAADAMTRTPLTI